MYPHVIRLRGPWQVEPLDGRPIIGTDGRTAQMTVPGQWRNFGLPDYWGRAILRRHFHWTAKLEPDEVVWLAIDQGIGNGPVRLNGVEIGRIESPWLEYRIDATARLRPSNLLEIELDASDPTSQRWGMLGFTERGTREAIGGVLGGVYLSIESRLLTLDWLRIRATWRDGKGRLEIDAGLDADSPGVADDARFTPRIAISLDGEIVEEVEWNSPATGRFVATIDGLDVQPWRGGSRQRMLQGAPHRHSLQFEGRVGGITCVDRTLEIGFVDVNDSTLECPAGFVSAERALLPFAGEDASKPFDQWSLARHGRLCFRGLTPPQSLLRLFDRAGMPIEIELPDYPFGCNGPAIAASNSREWQALRGALESHPCVTAIRRLG